MNTSKQIGFHGATVTSFCKHDDIIELELEDVLVDDRKSQILLIIFPALSLMMDGELSNLPLMAAEDGEVIMLEISENVLSLIIEWNDFSCRKSFTRSHQVQGGEISISMI